VNPTPWKTAPTLVAHSQEALDLLDLDQEVTETKEFLDWVAGNKVLEGSVPMAHRYGGYQFCYWADQLGDGRAHLLGEYANSRGQRWEIQLKGSGRTPYSRFGDGRAVLRSSVREFLCSEAMYHLGVPTSRAVSLIVTNDGVPRDLFYNGNVKLERGAVVMRLAPSWFRIGSLEILAKKGELEELRRLVDTVLETIFPDITETGDEAVLVMFSRVVDSTAELIARWSAVGFTHGVLNTDNLSLAGVTIDYGPFGFLDEYNTSFIPNHSDDMGRYDYQSQVNIGLWNLDKLAQALKPLLGVDKHPQLEIVLKGYGDIYHKHHLELFRAKLGLTSQEEDDEQLLDILLAIMESVEADFTQTFRDLSELSLEDLRSASIPEAAWGLAQCGKNSELRGWLAEYCQRLERDAEYSSEVTEAGDKRRMERMQAANPRYILRNWIAQKAIGMAEEDDFSEVQFLLDLFRNPYKMNKAAEEKGYASKPPNWSKTLSVSCSS